MIRAYHERAALIPEAVQHRSSTFFVSKNSTTKTTYISDGYIVKEKEREYIDFNAGDFWIGHSGLVHGVSENKQNVPRISMSFNIEPTLEFK